MKQVGRYEIRERIGEGAMADVYRAHDPAIERDVAIKVLKPEYRAQPTLAARFLREAQAAGALSHPNIVTIHDVGMAGDVPYFAMELIDGETLDHRLRRKAPLMPEAVLGIGAQLAAALAYAHAAGIVHRDIKPANIILRADGVTVTLLDFGIARVAEAHSQNELLRTQAGQVLGTPRYMSPEQALGRPLDGRSDLFSTGVVLYELVTGRPAFAGESAATLALQITQAEPAAIVGHVPDCSRGLQFIIGKLIAKRPERRFADGAQLGQAIARELATYSAAAAEAQVRSPRIPLAVRLSLAMVALVGLALAASVGTVLDRQYAAMERMALTSGASIAAFVASNAALPAVENAGLPPAERDWLPVQAFIAAASSDRNVTSMTMADADGIIRGATDPRLIDTRYATPVDERAVAAAQPGVTTTRDAAGFRFVRPIRYADRRVGTIDVVVSKAELAAAAAHSRSLLGALSGIVLLVVGATSFASAAYVARPLRRLRTAMADAARGSLDFRLSHRRRDEIGALFDGFNRLAAAVQDRLDLAGPPAPVLVAEANATRIAPAPTPVAPADSPFAGYPASRVA